MSRLRPAAVLGAVLVVLSVEMSPFALQVQSASTASDPVAAVNPFIGTANYGSTFPGADVPFGMAQVSPDTDATQYSTADYDYNHSQFIRGFSQTHLSGAGCYSLGQVPLMPVSGSLQTKPTNYQSTFSHHTESAHPGYYAVGLDTYGISAEVSATERTAWQRYDFHGAGSERVLIDLGEAIAQVRDASVRIVNRNTVEGSQSVRAFCGTNRATTLYFSAQFSKPFTGQGTWTSLGGNQLVAPGSAQAYGEGIGAYLSFAATKTPVVVKIGLSYVSVDGARHNLEVEGGRSGTFDFDAIVHHAQQAWRHELGAVEITTKSSEQAITFYTALYHSLLQPNVFSDVDHNYIGGDDRIHRAAGYVDYANFSLWDSYRTQEPLLGLVAPNRLSDMVASIAAFERDTGWLPKWTLNNIETNTMSGDPVTPFLSDAQASGRFDKVDTQAVYSAMLRNVTTEPTNSIDGETPEGRTGLADYLQRGYVPMQAGTTLDLQFSASVTLEYAAADCSLAMVGRRLGKPESAQFDVQSRRYRTLWDADSGYLRPRMSDGSFLVPFDPLSTDQPPGNPQAPYNGFHEGSASQYLWSPMHDAPALIEVLGGVQATVSRLDAFFALPPEGAKDYSSILRQEWTRDQGNTFDLSNEPDLQAPFFYDFLGLPSKTEKITRAATELFTNSVGGILGNDDLGSLSSWYVLASLGLYPIEPGSAMFALTSPLFDRSSIRLDDSSPAARALKIEAPKAPSETYVQSVTVDKHPLNQTWLQGSQLRDGGTLSFALGSQPSRWGTVSSARPPSACGS